MARISARSGQDGTYSATAVLPVRRRRRSVRERTESLAEYDRFLDTCWSSRAGTLFVFLASRWLELEPTANSRYFMLSTASLSALGYENDLLRPVIRFWNETRHVDTEAEAEVTAHAVP